MRAAVMPWLTLQKRRVGVGLILMCSYTLPWGLASQQDSHRNRVGRHEPTDARQQCRIRAILFQGERDWQGTLFGVGTIAAIPSVNK